MYKMFFAGILSDFSKTMLDFQKDENIIIPTNMFITGIDILKSLFISMTYKPNLAEPIKFLGTNISQLIKGEARLDKLTGTSFYAILQYFSTKRLAENVSIKKFIYTFENYSWEKLTIKALKDVSENIKVIGFQHAFVSKNSFKYFPGQNEKEIMPFPDKIINMGGRTKKILEEIGSYPKDIFRVGAALRQEYLSDFDVLARSYSKNIFLPLTITVSDTIKVYKFLYEAGLGEFSGKVYFRFHPTTDRKKVFAALDFDVPHNFVVSDISTVKEEIDRCGVVLYTWTTVALESLKLGRPVIYLDVNFPLDVDPLFECKYLRGVCDNPTNLMNEIERFFNMSNQEFEYQTHRAQEYLGEYFAPVNKSTMGVFISG